MMAIGEKALLDSHDRAYVVSAGICIGRSRRSGNDNKMLYDFLRLLVDFIDPDAHGADFRMELLETIGNRNDEMSPNSILALAQTACAIRYPAPKPEAVAPSAVSESPSKSTATLKKSSRRGAKR